MKTLKPIFAVFLAVVFFFQLQSQVLLVTEKTDSILNSNLTVAGSNLFFSSYNWGDSVEIWATNGPQNSPVLLNKFPTYFGSMERTPLFFCDFNGNLIFQALETYTIDEFWNPTFGPYLWKSDGTIEGTVKLKDLETWFYLSDAEPNTWGGKYIQLDDKLFFAATQPDTLNFELWSTDGTSGGTVSLLEINKSNQGYPWWPDYRSSFPSSLTKLGDKMYFSANDGIHGQELWVSDGTTTGTHLVKDIATGDTVSLDHYYHEETFVASNDKLFFTAFWAKQLWVSNGTEAGTKPINNFNYSFLSSNQGIRFKDLTIVNDELYYKVNYWNYSILKNDSTQLWKSDGTESGTTLVYNTSNKQVSSLISYKGTLYFLAKNESKHELWKSDGTEKGALKISEFQMPENNNNKLYTFNDSIYFAAFDTDSMLKIWKSDGTGSGTAPIKNWDEPGIISISEMVQFNDGLYFVAQYPNWGSAVFKYFNSEIMYTLTIPKSLKNSLSISPNPTSNYLNINLDENNAQGTITIYAITGAKVLSINVKAGEQIINTNVSSLKNGLYFVSYTNNSGTSTAKFFKE